eukprot:31327_1
MNNNQKQWKGASEKNKLIKYEKEWTKHESCCYCCGIRGSLLALSIFFIFEGFGSIGIAMWFSSNDIVSGMVINLFFGITIILLGIIGFYAAFHTKHVHLRIFWYWSMAEYPFLIAGITWAMVLFAESGNTLWVVIMAYDMIVSTFLWSYIAYKAKIFHDLAYEQHKLITGESTEMQIQSEQQPKTNE